MPRRAHPDPAPLPPSVTAITDAEPALTARSVIASTLLGVTPPHLPTQLLVRSGELFGIAEGTTRVALSRLAARGGVTASGNGYELAGKLLGRQARQSLSRVGATRAWQGQWDLQVVVAQDRRSAERTALRAAATSLRLAERREGVWLRPDNLPASHAESMPDAAAVIAAQCERYLVRPSLDPVHLAQGLWDLPRLTERGRVLLAAVDALLPRLAAGDLGVLGPAFVVSAAVLRHFQADPLLPSELLPGGWTGDELRTTYEQFDQSFKQAWRAWFRAQERERP